MALSNVPTDTWRRLTPLVQILGPRSPGGPFRVERVREWVRKIGVAVTDRAFFLDVLRLRATVPTRTSRGDEPVLSVVYAAARRRGLRFIPVLPVGTATSEEHRRIVREASFTDGRGIAFRYPILRIALPPGATQKNLLTTVLDQMQVDVFDSDLLIDLGFLSGVQELDPADMADLLSELAGIGRWRSVVLLGTSMPAGLGVIQEGTVGQLPRREWDLWCALKAQSPLRMPSYGDYAIQHPEPPSEGGMGMRANIRYTTAASTLVARGTGPVVLDTEQYLDLCRQLVERPEFAGRQFSWGDAVIEDRARGLGDPGSQQLWRGVGTSHHVQTVIDQISR